jgi:hypothetical protein
LTVLHIYNNVIRKSVICLVAMIKYWLCYICTTMSSGRVSFSCLLWYNIDCVTYINKCKSETCNRTKQNEIETKRNCSVSCFSIYLRVITNSRNCFVSFRFRFVSLISKNTHTTFYIYFPLVHIRPKLRSQGLVYSSLLI